MHSKLRLYLFFVLLLLTLTACAILPHRSAKPEMMPTTLRGVGHLGNSVGVSTYSVNGQWGGSVSGWGGGGSQVCCIQVPAKEPESPYMVTVKWESCDVHHIKFVNGMSTEPNPRCIKAQHQATVPVHYAFLKGQGGAGLKIHFLPGNRVEAWYTTIGPTASDYPGPAYSRGPAPDYAPVLERSDRTGEKNERRDRQ